MLNPLNSTALPTFTYGADPEGRPNSVGASTGVNPVLSTAYNVASRPTGLTLGSYDSDAFTFDPNTGRMTQYKHTVGASPQSVIGNLTWNANGTLKQLAITDPFNAANQQTCNYGYDDLTRINSANCGSPWSQTFGFDPFGNLTKSGSVSFQPTYNTATNRMQTLPGFTPTYDANGNTLSDSLHTYTWDVQGRVTAVDSVGLTYDALGRMVEQQRGTAYTQILYGPNGGKLALMNGQTVSKAFIPLPAGGTAVYTSGPTLSYFRHPDWLGSSRFASTPSRTMYSDLAYAPFGETYAEAGTDRSFTGQNQDTAPDPTAGFYDFLFREYAQYGRWVSPDPAGLAAVDMANPQSWNRYAYVMNNPLSLIDPLGMRWVCSGPPDDRTCHWEDDPDNPPPTPPWVITGLPVSCYIILDGLETNICSHVPIRELPDPREKRVRVNPNPPAPANNCTPGTNGCFNVPTQQQQQCISASSGSVSAQISGLTGLINNPVTHILDDISLMAVGAGTGAGTVAFDAYVFGQTGGLGIPIILMSNPSLFYGSWQMMKAGYNKLKGDVRELKNVAQGLEKPGC